MNAEDILEFTIIKEQLSGLALSEGAQSRIWALAPAMYERVNYLVNSLALIYDKEKNRSQTV